MDKKTFTPDPTPQEIEALIREVERSRRKKRVNLAVNPKHDYGQ